MGAEASFSFSAQSFYMRAHFQCGKHIKMADAKSAKNSSIVLILVVLVLVIL